MHSWRTSSFRCDSNDHLIPSQTIINTSQHCTRWSKRCASIEMETATTSIKCCFPPSQWSQWLQSGCSVHCYSITGEWYWGRKRMGWDNLRFNVCVPLLGVSPELDCRCQCLSPSTRHPLESSKSINKNTHSKRNQTNNPRDLSKTGGFPVQRHRLWWLSMLPIDWLARPSSFSILHTSTGNQCGMAFGWWCSTAFNYHPSWTVLCYLLQEEVSGSQ